MFPLSFQSQPSAPLELLNEYNPRSLANTAHVSFSGVFAAISFFFFWLYTTRALEPLWKKPNMDQGQEMAKLSD